MNNQPDQEYLINQYRNSSNLNARAGLHTRFSTDQYPWFQWVFDHFEVPNNGQILELGCGTGTLWRENLGRIPYDWRVILTDVSQGMLQESENALLHSGLQFSFREVNAKSIPYKENSFDVVIANHMLYHVPDLAGALGEIRRVLKPRGQLYATTVGSGHMHDLSKVPKDIGITPSASPDHLTRQFNLDNGLAALEHWFDDIKIDRRRGTLLVTEAAPLVAYLMSFTPLSNEESAELHVHFEKEIQLKGAFKIKTETGLFTAEKQI